MEAFDLVIVGAGIHGLMTLKTYRHVHPTASVLVIEKGSSLGGVWAEDRLYPGLHTNNHFRTFEFSDHPMETDGFDLESDHIPGEHVNKYLHDFATTFNLLKHMRLDSNVESAVDHGTLGWTLTVVSKSANGRSKSLIKTAKLIVATGLTSEPFMPKLEGKESFGAPIYHTSELSKAENGLGPFKRVVLLSGAKFSWDIACAYASAGVQVDWIIRESGHGPCWMTPPRLTPFKIIPELLLQTRLITWLSPCIWEDGFSYIRDFFSRHWLGRRIVDAFFAKMQHSIEDSNRYHEHPETNKLHPWDDVFFIGTNRGLLNYDVDFFDFVRNGTIRVHIADVAELGHQTVHLTNGDMLKADVLICGTGWKDTPQIAFVSEKELGLPGHLPLSAKPFLAEADCAILEAFPKLQNQPPSRKSKLTNEDAKKAISEPYRLYRFMVPPAFIDSHTLAFSGAYRSPATTFVAQTQALWITAFFDNNVPALDSDSEATSCRVLYETVLHTQFGKWRYSKGFGARFPELWFDCLPYVDLLLKDIDVPNQRKRNWWAERFTPYMPVDYIGIVDDYLALKMRRRASCCKDN